LPQDLGQALARYVRQRPKGATCRRIFLSLQDAGPVGANTISALAVLALKQAAIHCARPGAHIFRHTVASHLVQKGASLKAVADWLGHRHLSATQLYAKVNLPMLRTVAQPWPCPEVSS
jgi:site-specific recombinase XerD